MNSKRILIFLVAFLIFLDGIMLYFFIIINPQLSIYSQIFEFIGTKQFTTITISLILPIIVFIIDYLFKIQDKIMEDTRTKQMDIINQTEALWSDIGKISAEFMYMEKFEEKKIGLLRAKVEEFIIHAEAVVNSWHFEFSKPKKILGKREFCNNDIHFTDIYLAPFNILLASIVSIIDFRNLTQLNTDDKQRQNLQEYIFIIYEGIKGASHHLTINILKNSMLYSENPDKKIEQRIIEDFDNLKKFSFYLIKEMYEFYPYESSNNAFKEFNGYINAIKDSEDYNYKTFQNDIRTIYNNLPNNEKITLKDNYQFPMDLIEHYAHIMKIEEVSSNFNHTRKQYMILKNKYQ